MSGCRSDKKKCNCGARQNAKCVQYDGYLPEYSLLDGDCVNIEETTEELYKNQETILDAIDLKDLGKDCIDYSEFQVGTPLKVNEALQTLEKEICELKSITEDSSSNDLELDLKCLTTTCGTGIFNLKELLQALINKVCDLETRVTAIENQQ